jgi:Fe2+ or Zn2+ uptake regulation protein
MTVTSALIHSTTHPRSAVIVTQKAIVAFLNRTPASTLPSLYNALQQLSKSRLLRSGIAGGGFSPAKESAGFSGTTG